MPNERPSQRLSTQLRLAPTRYVPVDRIAAGGMAEVWRANAMFEHGGVAEVAIKRVLPNLAIDPLFRAMFEDEARLGMLLRHPNIVRVYGARDVGGTFIMIMELVDGAPLRSMLDFAIDRHQGLPIAAALHIARELARALEYAHGAVDEKGVALGLIHRDVSPHNVLLGRDGAVKLVDFGLASSTTNRAKQADHMVGGKLGYLAPEIISQGPQGPRLDVFAVGIVLWEMLAGRRLFQRANDQDTVRAVAACEIPSVASLRAGLPAGIDDVLARILAKDPARRLPGASALFGALDRLVGEVDSHVGAKDIALIVGLYRAQQRARPAATPPDVAQLLARELDQFVAAYADDAGAVPLDPSEFTFR